MYVHCYYSTEFDWDEANIGHIAQHAISPAECEEAYCNGPLVVAEQLRSGEYRNLCLGHTSAGRLLTFVVTERNGKIRFVTAHPMHQKQRKIFIEE